MKGRVLITGGAGFIGFHLARALCVRGYEVHLLDNFARAARDRELARLLAHDQAALLEIDLLAGLGGLADDYDVICHFAALLGVENVRKNPYAVLTRNNALLEQAIALGRKQRALQRFLFTSTSEVYGGTLRYHQLPIPSPESAPLTVNDLTEPRTSYMLSKIYGEALCIHSGLPYTNVRPHNVYGPRMGLSHVVPQLLERAHGLCDGDALDVYSVDHRRTFCYIDDGVELLIRMIERPQCAGQTLNLGTEAPEVTIGELAKTVIATVGKRLSINPLPATAGSPPRRAPSMARCTALCDYWARITLEEGVQRTYDWYRAQIFEGDDPSAS
jgi:UDP-glucose 4-epimerase